LHGLLAIGDRYTLQCAIRYGARNNPGQDLLWKFNIPWSERVYVLKMLDEHNVNAF
jgi:hypothetical protein